MLLFRLQKHDDDICVLFLKIFAAIVHLIDFLKID